MIKGWCANTRVCWRQELYETARALANGVVPNEYGVAPKEKLKIGSQICSQLLGKLLADLGNTREESKATANLSYNPKMSEAENVFGAFDTEFGAYSFEEYLMGPPNIGSRGGGDDNDSEEANDGAHDPEVPKCSCWMPQLCTMLISAIGSC